jgi:uncharacterized protein
MNYLSGHFVRRAHQTCLAVFFIVTVCGLVSAQPTESKTNTAWLPLADLLKKWEGVPWEQVQMEAEKENPLAQHYLGYCYMQGLRVAANPEMGASWYRRGMTNGYAPSANNLGVAYARGLLGSDDSNRAIYYYTYAAEHGYVPCELLLYYRYWDGNGVVSDHAKAMQWLTKAANAGSPEALYLMGYRCENPDYQMGSDVIPARNFVEACQWYRRAADQNYAEAQYHLGLFYFAGQVVEQDEERGLELVRAAADQGLNDALIELAKLYAHGVGEPRSVQERPMQLYERAHDYSHLILRYRYGMGTDRDMIAVARCYVSLANDPKSWFWSPEELVKRIPFKPGKQFVGMRIEDGYYWPPEEDIPNEDMRFLSLYLKSALGDGQSALEIANCYLVGKDVPKSAPNAWLWLTLAGQNGSSEGTVQLRRLEPQMDSDATGQARKKLPSFLQELNKVGGLLRTHGGGL